MKRKVIPICVGIIVAVVLIIVGFTNIDELVYSEAPNIDIKVPADISLQKQFDVKAVQKEIKTLIAKNLELRTQEARIADQLALSCTGNWDENLCPSLQKKHQEMVDEIYQLEKHVSELVKQRDEYLAEHPDEIIELEMENYP